MERTNSEEQDAVEDRRFRRKICNLGKKFLVLISCFAIRGFFKLLKTEGADCSTLEKELARAEKDINAPPTTTTEQSTTNKENENNGERPNKDELL